MPARRQDPVPDEPTIHYSSVMARFSGIGLEARQLRDRHRVVHTVMVSIPQRDEAVRPSKILFEFRVEHDNVLQSEYDSALRAYLEFRTRYSWTEDPRWARKSHGRAEVARARQGR